jgi:hypothetical protein
MRVRVPSEAKGENMKKVEIEYRDGSKKYFNYPSKVEIFFMNILVTIVAVVVLCGIPIRNAYLKLKFKKKK